MIAKIFPVTSMNSMVFYHETKCQAGVGNLLSTNVLINKQSYNEIAKGYREHLNLNDKVSIEGYSISLNFSPEDKVTTEDLNKISQEYLSRMGWNSGLTTIYQHTDKSHNHVHILISPTDLEGRKIDDSFYKIRSQAISRDIEKEYNIIQVEYKKFNNAPLNEINSRKYYYQTSLKKALKSTQSKERLTNVIPKNILSKLQIAPLTNDELKTLLGDKKYNFVGIILSNGGFFTSLYKDEILQKLDYFSSICKDKNELFDKLSQNGIYVRHLTEKGKNYYLYGMPETNFYTKDYNLPLKYRYSILNKTQVKTETNNLVVPVPSVWEQKHILYNSIRIGLNGCHSMDDFTKYLTQNQIGFAFASNSNGIYGISFSLSDIENATVFKGTDINRAFSFSKLLNHFNPPVMDTIHESIKPLPSSALNQLVFEMQDQYPKYASYIPFVAPFTHSYNDEMTPTKKKKNIKKKRKGLERN